MFTESDGSLWKLLTEKQRKVDKLSPQSTSIKQKNATRNRPWWLTVGVIFLVKKLFIDGKKISTCHSKNSAFLISFRIKSVVTVGQSKRPVWQVRVARILMIPIQRCGILVLSAIFYRRFFFYSRREIYSIHVRNYVFYDFRIFNLTAKLSGMSWVRITGISR